jgi:hypothetical protein
MLGVRYTVKKTDLRREYCLLNMFVFILLTCQHSYCFATSHYRSILGTRSCQQDRFYRNVLRRKCTERSRNIKIKRIVLGPPGLFTTTFSIIRVPKLARVFQPLFMMAPWILSMILKLTLSCRLVAKFKNANYVKIIGFNI